MLGLAFWPVFVIVSLLQIFIDYFFTSWKKQKARIELEKIENERLKEYSKQGIDCLCPDENCGTVTFVPIQLNLENRYDCPKCKKGVKIYIGCKTFLETTTVDENPFKDFNFVEGKDYDN